MAKTYEEILAEALKAKGLSMDSLSQVNPEEPQPPVPSVEPATVPETPVLPETADVEEPTIDGFQIESDAQGVVGMQGSASGATELDGFDVAEEPIAFDSTTVLTPEMLQGMDYETLYGLAGTDSPLDTGQRDILANALRGSSDLADILSGYNPSLGSDTSGFEAPKNRGDVAKNYTKAYSEATSGNKAILEAVKNARTQYLKDNPNTPQGYLDQVNQGVLTGAAAPIPTDATSPIAPSFRRGVLDTAAQSASFGFADDILGAEGPTALDPQKSRESFAESNPGTALAAELAGGVLSPSVGMKGLQLVGKGLKETDRFYHTIGKVMLASAEEASLAAIGNGSDQPFTDALIGGAVGGGVIGGAGILKGGLAATKGLAKLFSGDKGEADIANSIVNDIALRAKIKPSVLRESIDSNKNIVDTLTENGVSVEDAGALLRGVSNNSATNDATKALADLGKSKIATIVNMNSEDANKYLKKIDPEVIGKEIGDLFKLQSGSDIANVVKRLMDTDGKSMHGQAIREAIADRTKVQASILEGSGRTTIKPADILIDQETGGIYVPKDGAKRLGDEEAKTANSKFGYATDDLYEITEFNDLRGDVFQSANSKVARLIDFKEGQTPDQAFSRLVTNAAEEAKQITEQSIEGLGKANSEFAKRKASKDAFDLTSSFVKKTTITPEDIKDYSTAMKALKGAEKPERTKAVLNSIKNYLGSNTKTVNIIGSDGKFDPVFRKAFSKQGISAEELDMFEKMASDKTFFAAFNKSTGIVDPKAEIGAAINRGVYQMIIHAPAIAIKNTVLSMIGNQMIKANKLAASAGDGYSEMLTSIASLDEKEFVKIKKLMTTKEMSILAATMKVIAAKTASSAGRAATAQ